MQPSRVRPAQPTLSGRFTRSVFLLTLALFVLFSGTLLFVVYSLEDAVYKEQLKAADTTRQRGGHLPDNIEIVSDLSALEVEGRFPILSVELDPGERFGEFNANGRHYHYMLLDEAYLLLDSTEVSIVMRAIDDILLLLLITLIPALLLSLWVARATAAHALKPFQQLGEVFTQSQAVSAEDRASLEDIAETDIKQIAQELLDALDSKALATEQQAAFSQGMAHELRTPLQVMTHSLELLAQAYPAMSASAPFSRLEKSLTRMQRISSALLWLSSNQAFAGCIDAQATIRSTLAGMEDALNRHRVDVEVNCPAPCELPLPDEVLALIVANLLHNLVHHGVATQDRLIWRIEVDGHGVRFANRAPAPDCGASPGAPGFGIGLLLVEKLAARFGLDFACGTESGWFVATLAQQAEGASAKIPAPHLLPG